MARTSMADVVLIFGVGGVFAYFSNFMGFRNWWDVNVAPNFGITPGQPGGTGVFAETQPVKTNVSPKAVPCPKQCADKWPGRTPVVENGVCYCRPKKTTTTKPVNYPLGKFYSSGNLWCWRNYPCNSKTPVAICQTTQQAAYSLWVSRYKCGGALTPAQKCAQLEPSCKGNLNPCLCRCGKLCAKQGKYPLMKADYSCGCSGARSVLATVAYPGYGEMPTVA